MIIILTAEESEDQLVAGIPEYIEFDTNVPATIFYTLDGSVPDEYSEIAIGRVFLPTNKGTVTLKAVAISGSFSSAVFEDTYFTSQPDQERNRFYFGSGISILPAGETPIDSRAFDIDGNPAQETTIPFQDLDIQASFHNSLGEKIDGTTVSFVNKAKTDLEKAGSIYSNPSDEYFNPHAQFIFINGSTQEEMSRQVVRIVNRPTGTFGRENNINKSGLSHNQYHGGNLNRYFYNPETGVIVFYYSDSEQARFMQSVQKTERKTLEFSPLKRSAAGVVLKWINLRSMSKIY